ncbi:MAG TPA: HD domain-containing protein, partial [Dongiaceae bacterium]|nr:HD domain-containing protein [Dongiaceae bacterium]
MSTIITGPATIAGIRVPDSALARAATQLVRDSENDLLYQHSRRVFFWGALTGERRKLRYDPELLYIGAMFHDMGLTAKHASKDFRFEVDGANAARDFLKSYDIPERDVDDVWTAIALHTTPGVPEHMRPTVALLTNGVEMDVLGIAYHDFTEQQRQHVC